MGILQYSCYALSHMHLLRRPLAWILAIVLIPVIAYAALLLVTHPRSDRQWAGDHLKAAAVETKGNQLVVRDLRDFQYMANGKVTARFRDQTYDMSKLLDVWFVSSPFKDLPSAAHTFFTFRFSDGNALAVSVEARREVGEDYSVWKGMLRQYELLYVWGTERDLLRLRAVARGDTVQLFKTSMTPAQGKAFLTALAAQSEAARTVPRFYNSLSANCTTEMFRAVNSSLNTSLPMWGTAMIFSAKTPESLMKAGLIQGPVDYAKSDITDRLRTISNDARFSERLRQTN